MTLRETLAAMDEAQTISLRMHDGEVLWYGRLGEMPFSAFRGRMDRDVQEISALGSILFVVLW